MITRGVVERQLTAASFLAENRESGKGKSGDGRDRLWSYCHQSPANSIPPFNTHLALPALPRDVIIAAWNYSETREWPVPKYFSDKGFPVVVCPWKAKRNTISLVDTAKKHNLLGLLATTWDSLDVCQPSVAEAGVLAWTAPRYELKVPFDHWLSAIRVFPICELPKLEETLEGGRRKDEG